MKSLKVVLLLISFMTFGMALSSCGDKSKKEHQTEHQGKEYTSAFVCPMHCEGSGSDMAGNCPVCGMEYEKNVDHKADGHKHEDHKDHDH